MMQISINQLDVGEESIDTWLDGRTALSLHVVHCDEQLFFSARRLKFHTRVRFDALKKLLSGNAEVRSNVIAERARVRCAVRERSC